MPCLTTPAVEDTPLGTCAAGCMSTSRATSMSSTRRSSALNVLSGLLWNCDDIMPGHVRGALSELRSALGFDDELFTVAQACRWLRPNLEEVAALR